MGILGLDIGGTKTAVVLGDRAGRIFERAEFATRADRGFQVFLTMGTGFGGGLIIDGRLYRGTSDLAGEVGHVRLAEHGPCAFGKAGSWEGLCGGAGIAKLAAERFPRRWPPGQVSARDLTELARAGDADAVAVLKSAGISAGGSPSWWTCSTRR